MAFPGSELGETWGGTGFGGGGNQSLILDLLSLSCISKEDVELAGGDTSAVFSLRKRSRQRQVSRSPQHWKIFGAFKWDIIQGVNDNREDKSRTRHLGQEDKEENRKTRLTDGKGALRTPGGRRCRLGVEP